VDAEVEGAEAVLPRGGVDGEPPADGAEEAARGGAGGGGVEALEHGLGGAVRGVARGRAVRQEGIDVLVLAPWRRHSASAHISWWARFADKRDGDGWMVRVWDGRKDSFPYLTMHRGERLHLLMIPCY